LRVLRRRLVLSLLFVAAFLLSSEDPRAQARSFDLLTASIADIHAAVDAGALTYERLVGLYLKRIDAYDKQGPSLRAILAINPRAAEIARALDEERKAKGRRSLLHGIPIAVKDNIDTAGMPTTGGNEAFANSRPASDATIIQRLRDAGAIIFVKTNMDEMAQATAGISTVGGQILNPYDLTKGPGGSSGGTGVAIAAGFATVGLGTETGVSVRSPASNNMLVGIVPSRGLVSRAGVIPISFTQDRIGPLAKTVADAAILLTHMRGFDADDLSTAENLERPLPTYTTWSATGLRGKRIGVLRDMFRKGDLVQAGNAVIEKQLDLMRAQGAIVVDGLATGVDLLGLMPTLRVNSYELQQSFDSYLRRRGPASPMKTFGELYASGKWLKGGILETRFHETMQAGTLETNVEYQSRLANQKMVRDLLVGVMNRYGVEALVYPMKPLAAPKVGAADDGPRDNNISAVTGLPAIVLPSGMDAAGLPLAIEMLGRPFSETTLLQLAHSYEQASRHRVPPKSSPPLAGETIQF
jgi:Asp-tRNA(Asn)/Glu-tRNA(Gln) amidotransferase A subunit family amidase